MNGHEYGRHPSEVLQNLFQQKPYQGRNPAEARYIIFGIDANFPINIHEDENNVFFQRVLEYLEDGPAFCRRYGVHHPFLLEENPYRKGGKTYHQNIRRYYKFKNIEEISFIELLNIPTFGRTGNNQDILINMINIEHFQFLQESIFNSLNNQRKDIFISPGVKKAIDRIRNNHDAEILQQIPAGNFVRPCRINDDKLWSIHYVNHANWLNTKKSKNDVNYIEKIVQGK